MSRQSPFKKFSKEIFKTDCFSNSLYQQAQNMMPWETPVLKEGLVLAFVKLPSATPCEQVVLLFEML